MTATELLSFIAQWLLIGLSLLSLADFVRQRDAIRRDIALMFAALATPHYILAAVLLFSPFSVELLTVLGYVAYFALLAQPFLMLALLRYFRPLPRRLLVAGFVAMLLSWLGIYLVSLQSSPVLVWLIVVYFVAVDGYAMVGFIRGAMTTAGVTRVRLRFAAVGCALLSFMLVLSGLQVLAPGSVVVNPTFGALLGIATGMAFFLGFAPLPWLARIWRFDELRTFLRQTTERAARKGFGETQIYDALCLGSLRAVGGMSAAVVQQPVPGADWVVRSTTDAALLDGGLMRAGQSVFSANLRDNARQYLHGSRRLSEDERRLLAGAGAEALLAVPISATAGVRGLLLVFLRYGSLFAQEDLRLLTLFAQHSAILIDNSAMVEQLRVYSQDLQRIIDQRTEALRQSEERYRQIIESAQEGIWMFDAENRTALVNPKLAELLGYSADEMLGMPLNAFLNGSDDNAEIVAQVLHPEKAFQGELNLRRKDGSDLWVHMSTNHMPRATEQYAGALAMVVDITERKATNDHIRKLNAELEQRVAERTEQLSIANRELEAFSYSVSHDLRAPLRALSGFSHVLLEDYGDQLDEQGRHYLNRITEGSQRMGELIDDMLQLSRLSRVELKRRSVDLSAMARATLANLAAQDPERNVSVTVEDGLVVDGDEHLLQIALGNLLDNAWKYTRNQPEARITFGVQQQDGDQVYYVRDNGAGFDMTYSDKLFGAFQRLHTGHEFEGTGIGLATVQRVIARHSGNIWAEAEVNKGATFYFTLGS